jgi:hypothetical protein
VQIGAGQHQHGAGNIDSDGTLGPLANQPQHAALSGTDVKQLAHGLVCQSPEYQNIHPVLVLEMRDFPAYASLGHHSAGCLCPAIEHRVQPLPIQLDLGIILGDDGKKRSGQFRASTDLGHPVVHPVLLAVTLQQACVTQEFQVARNPGLTLTGNLLDFGDGEFPPGADRQQPQSAGLRRCLQSFEKTLEIRHPALQHLLAYKDIFIC